MNRKIFISTLLAVTICCGGCTNTRYLTDSMSIARQHDMRKHRTGRNLGDVCKYLIYSCISKITDSERDFHSSERIFKRITLRNESADSLFVNMVTDIVWKKTGYCDIMGIALPPYSQQKLLVPFPAAYNAYFKTRFSDEEKFEIRTDNKHRVFRLRAGMTLLNVD